MRSLVFVTALLAGGGGCRRSETLVGVYHRIDVRQKRPDPPVYLGHVALRLGDGTEVFLEPVWSPAALRPADEVARFDGQRVAVTGMLHTRLPDPADARAEIIAPCVTPVEWIEPVR